ncbi:MAG: hypothetical protein ACRDQD_23805 [Nocardioidaceae bacterium]|jgi:restriction system protein
MAAPAVELIDGDRLCDLLKEYELAVHVTLRTVEDIEVVPTFSRSTARSWNE